MASRVLGACRATMMAAAKAGSRSSPLPSPARNPASAAAATGAAKKPKVKAAKSATPGSALLRPNPVSPALGDFMGGVSEASRSGAVKKIWEHIKANNLQDPVNKKLIHCDVKLKTIFDGKDQVSFLEIAKLVSAHFIKTPVPDRHQNRHYESPTTTFPEAPRKSQALVVFVTFANLRPLWCL